ncbi:WD40-repeat-containing domain protein [Microdochium trichocladiopsis]|uniref:WD40-repeat-containing domain protein n=1 Tax=Microdochium trichocladiopsis TaxID=1682393 RepID=A0A9P8YBL3_9PEZI|nr:WD40-repeat-containing domain protein [Microdochium trichocladiopsis]KAH7033202.1 WD40-repeat-containing domain protein [Microdochium trichocladiopsis]
MAFPDKPISHLLGSNGPIHALAYSASPGTYILTGSADRSIRLYNPLPTTSVHPATAYVTRKPGIQPYDIKGGIGSHDHPAPAPAVSEGRLIQTYSAHGYEVLSLSISADNARFASSGGDRSVFLWDVATAQTLRRFGGTPQSHTARINCVAFAGEDDMLLVSGSLDATARIWDAKSNALKPVQVLSEAKDAITSVAVRGSEIVTGSVDGRVRSYDVRMGRCTTDVIGPPVTSVSMTKDAKALLVGGLDNKVRLMDRENGNLLRAYEAPEFRNENLRVQSILGGKEQYVLCGDEMTTENPAGLASAAGAGRLWAWNILTGEVKAKISVPWGPAGYEPRKKAVGRDGKEKERVNVVSCIAWREDGFGDQFCVGGTSGVVTVFGYQ